MGEAKEEPLICPECRAWVAWNGVQYVCIGCPWTEHKVNPPSDLKIPARKKTTRFSKPNNA
jgi:hypothetical protein